jgi:glyoxylase-like metal-dependent hydrolase (beta-lactamase superfamily II)
MREVVDGVFEIGLGFVNLHLVVIDDGVVLVDTGLPGRGAAIEKALHEARHAVGDIRHILLTHWHPDHVGNVAGLRTRSSARVLAHAADVPLITGEKPIQPKGIQRVMALFMKAPEASPVDDVITADGPVPVPGFQVVHTPGHTAGHVSYLLDRAGGVLFAGDAVGSSRGAVRRTPKIVDEDHDTAGVSARRLAELPFAVAVFGHGGPISERAADRFRAFAAR